MMIRMDSILGTLTNASTGMGDRRYDPTQDFGLRLDPGGGLGQVEQSELVRRHGLLRKVVSNIPKACTSRWGMPTLTKGDPETVSAIAQALKEIEVLTLTRTMSSARKAFQTGMIDAFRTGNAGIVMDIDDGRRMDEPINLKGIRSLRKLMVLDRWTITPDLRMRSSGRWEHYQVIQRTGGIVDQQLGRIHASRVLWITGAETDDHTRQYSSGCDDSILEGVLRGFILFLSSVEGAGRMIQDYDVMVHEISGLLSEFGLGSLDGPSASGGGTADPCMQAGEQLRERLTLNHKFRSMFRAMVVDKDTESLSNIGRSASGYSDLVEPVKMYLLSSTDYPPAVLFGEFSSGIDSSGKSQEEKELWNESIGQVQEDKLSHLMLGSIKEGRGRSPRPGLLQILCLAKDGPTKGKIPEGLGWKWELVYPPSASEQADLESKRGQLIQTIGGIDPNFVPNALLSHYAGETFNPNITLSEEYITLLEKQVKNPADPAEQEAPPPEEGAEPPGEGEGEAAAPEGEGEEANPLDSLSEEEIAQLPPEEAQRLLEQIESRGDSADRIDAMPMAARRNCRKALYAAKGMRGGQFGNPIKVWAAKVGNGKPASHASLLDVQEWFQNHASYRHARSGTPAAIAYQLRGGDEMRRWVETNIEDEGRAR